jgi:hypothetical protein
MSFGGIATGIYYKRTTYYKTLLGSCFTILFLIFILFYAFVCFREVMERNNWNFDVTF